MLIVPELFRVVIVPLLLIPFAVPEDEIEPVEVFFKNPRTPEPEIASPKLETETLPLVGMPIVRLPPVQTMPVEQELVIVVSPDTVGQVCAWTAAIAIKAKGVATAMCLIFCKPMGLNSKVYAL